MSWRRAGIGVGVIGLLFALWLWKSDSTQPQPANKGSAAAQSEPPRWRSAAPQRLRSSVSGTVVLRGSASNAGATVCVFANQRPLLPRCQVTPANGDFRIEEVASGDLTIAASASGFIGAKQEASVKESEALEGHDFELSPGGQLVIGRVLDIGGGPVAGATVFVGYSSGPAAITDADGEFRIQVAKKIVDLSARADGYATGYARTVAPSADLDIEVVPESVVRGVVVLGETDERVPGAEVSIVGYSAATVTSDEQGQFEVRGLEPGRYVSSARSSGLFGLTTSLIVGLAETAGPVRVQLYPAATVKGRVVVDGAPCPAGDARLSRDDPGPNSNVDGDISPDGTVFFDAVLPGVYSVRIDCAGAFPKEGFPAIEVRDADIGALEWIVSAGRGAIRGRVVDDRGRPVAGASVSTTQLDDALTDSQGWFELVGFDSGEQSLSPSKDGYFAPSEQPKTVTGDRSARLLLHRGATLIGKVVREDGRPTTNARVTGEWIEPPTTTESPDGRVIITTTTIVSELTKAGVDGTFIANDLQPGELNLTAFDDWWSEGGSDKRQVFPVSVVLRAGETTRVELRVETHTAVVAGRVVDERGAPVSDAFVQVDRAGGGVTRLSMQHGVLTDTDGRFEIKDVPPGPLAVRAFRRGGGEAQLEAASGTDLLLTIADTASVGGRARIGGQEIPWLHVQVHGARAQRTEVFYRTDGRWTIRDLPPGPYSITVSYGSNTAEAEVTLGSGEQERGLNWQLKPRRP